MRFYTGKLSIRHLGLFVDDNQEITFADMRAVMSIPETGSTSGRINFSPTVAVINSHLFGNTHCVTHESEHVDQYEFS